MELVLEKKRKRKRQMRTKKSRAKKTNEQEKQAQKGWRKKRSGQLRHEQQPPHFVEWEGERDGKRNGSSHRASGATVSCTHINDFRSIFCQYKG